MHLCSIAVCICVHTGHVTLLVYHVTLLLYHVTPQTQFTLKAGWLTYFEGS